MILYLKNKISLSPPLLPPSSWLRAGVLGAPCLVAARLSFTWHHSRVSAPSSSSFKDSNHTGLEPIPMNSLEPDCIYKESVSNMTAFTLVGLRASTQTCGYIILPITQPWCWGGERTRKLSRPDRNVCTGRVPSMVVGSSGCPENVCRSEEGRVQRGKLWTGMKCSCAGTLSTHLWEVNCVVWGRIPLREDGLWLLSQSLSC